MRLRRGGKVLSRLLRPTDDVKKGDERWILIDRDTWEEELLNKVNQDARKNGVKVGLSNPCFELWLYLHIGDNRPFNDRHHCQREFTKIFKDYSKGEYDAKSLLRGVHKAIKRAKPDTEDANAWPPNQSTRVYLMVEKLFPNRSRKSLK